MLDLTLSELAEIIKAKKVNVSDDIREPPDVATITGSYTIGGIEY